MGAAPLVAFPTPLTARALEATRSWFRSHAREYPWSLTRDPYALWISEIMLQQTVVKAGIVPYTRWMARWPDLASLAAATEADVLAAWEGLGYASRARNLHRAATRLVSAGRTTLPSTYEELRALPGVGDYTASALLSFAFDQPVLTLDANLKRIFLRLSGVPVWKPELEVAWRQLWSELVDGPSSREANQAVMQLGQLVCTSRRPACGDCPLAEGCLAWATDLQESIPTPPKREITALTTRVAVWTRQAPGGEVEYWLARPSRGRFSTLWLFPPVPEGPVGVEGRPLTGRVHSYTRYRDALAPTWYRLPPETAEGPLPTGWGGLWTTAEQAARLGLVSVYRKILDEAVGLA